MYFISNIFTGVATWSSVGQSILQVSAVDEDSADQVKYNLTGGNTNSAFQIGYLNGILTNRILMDNANIRTYDLDVLATDSNLQDTAKIVVGNS